MISDEKFAVSQELMEQAYDYLKDGYEQALNALEEAEAENTKLRKELEAEHALAETLGHFYEHAQAENAKLRELCKDMMAFVEDDDACERCGHDAECVEAADGELVLPYEGRCLMLDLFADRMRELGVEVDA